jgi:hypothetical protein
MAKSLMKKEFIYAIGGLVIGAFASWHIAKYHSKTVVETTPETKETETTDDNTEETSSNLSGNFKDTIKGSFPSGESWRDFKQCFRRTGKINECAGLQGVTIPKAYKRSLEIELQREFNQPTKNVFNPILK